MKIRYLPAIVSLALGLGTTLASAQEYIYPSPPGSGPYFRVGAGPSFFEHGRLSGFGGPAGNPIEYRTGLAANAAIGYAFDQYFAMDFELGVVGAEIKSVPGFFSDNTFVDNVPFLANVTLSLPLPRSVAVPYIGIGAGGSATIFDTDGFGNGSAAVFGRESDVVFAWQVFAGLRFKLNRQMSFGVGYKYFATEDPSFSYPPAFPFAGPNFAVGLKGVRTHSVLVSFQMKFW